MKIQITIHDNILLPPEFTNLLQERNFEVEINHATPSQTSKHVRNEHTTDYAGIRITVKKGCRIGDAEIISILEIFGNKLTVSGTEELIKYVNKITRESLLNT